MSKKHYNKNKSTDRYGLSNNARPDFNELPSDEEVGEAELNVKNLDTEFVPNALMYNAYGITPSTATYRILMSELKAMFTKVCKQQIDGVSEVTAVFDSTIGEVQFFCSFVENCHHFNDRSMEGTAISDQPAKYYSKEVRAFAKKFGMNPQRDCVRDKNGKILGPMANLAKNRDQLNIDVLFVPNIDRSNNFTRTYSMRLSWTTLIRLIFDMDGKAFEAQYNRKPARCKLDCHFEFIKTNDAEFGKPQYLEVIKSTNGSSIGSGPRPKVAFNYREV